MAYIIKFNKKEINDICDILRELLTTRLNPKPINTARRIVVERMLLCSTETVGTRYVWTENENIWSWKSNCGTSSMRCDDINYLDKRYNYICEYHDGLDIQSVGRDGGAMVVEPLTSWMGMQPGRRYSAERQDGNRERLNYVDSDGNMDSRDLSHFTVHHDNSNPLCLTHQPVADKVTVTIDAMSYKCPHCHKKSPIVEPADIPPIDADHPLTMADPVVVVKQDSNRFDFCGHISSVSKHACLVVFQSGAVRSFYNEEVTRIPPAELQRRWNRGAS